MALHISLAAEPVAHIGNFAITNALFTTWVLMSLIAVALYFGTRKLHLIPVGAFQNILELVVEGLYGLVESVAGNKAPRFFTIVFSFFLFIMLSNWSGLLPGVGTIGFYESATEEHAATPEVHAPVIAAESQEPVVLDDHGEPIHTEPATEPLHVEQPAVESHATTETTHAPAFVPLFRAPTADLNFTIALALISVITIHTVGFRSLGFSGHASKYFDFSSPINFYVGILELIGEFSKIISFAFRLFGNIFAGEVLLVVIASLIPYIAPLPFIFLEIFVGFIQGLVFAILTLVFLTMASTSHHAEEH